MAEENPPHSESSVDSPAEKSYTPPVRSNPKRRRNILILVIAVVVLVAGVFLWRYLSSYESTDDAQADV
ncbi:MAG: hypothetical protein WA232_04510, partial [Candidatus Sulfotelmatobacter sp.]